MPERGLSAVAGSKGCSGVPESSGFAVASFGAQARGCSQWAVALWAVAHAPDQVEPVSPALAGQFLTTGPPGDPEIMFFPPALYPVGAFFFHSCC